MRIEQQRKATLRQRRGSTKRTIMQSIWLLVTAAGAYGLLWWLNSSEIFTYQDAYKMGIPASIPEWGVMVGAVIFVVFIAQIIFIFGYILGSPQGRTPAGKASAYSARADLEAAVREDDEDY